MTSTVLVELHQTSKQPLLLTLPSETTVTQLSKIINQQDVSFYINNQKIQKNLSFHLKDLESKLIIEVIKNENEIKPAGYFKRSYDGHNGAILDISFNNNKNLITVGGDRSIVYWDYKSKTKSNITLISDHWVQCVDSHINDNVNFVLAGSMDNSVNFLVYETSTKSLKFKKKILINKKPITSVKFLDSKNFLVTSRDFTVTHIEFQYIDNQFDYKIVNSYTHSSQVLGCEVFEYKNKIIASFSAGKILLHEFVGKLKFRQEIKIKQEIRSLEIGNKGNCLLIGCDNGEVYIYNTEKTNKNSVKNSEIEEFEPFYFKKKIQLAKDSISCIKQYNTNFYSVSSYDGAVYSINIADYSNRKLYSHISPVLCLNSLDSNSNVVVSACMTGYIRIFDCMSDKVVTEYCTKSAIYCMRSLVKEVKDKNKNVEIVAGGADGKLYFFG